MTTHATADGAARGGRRAARSRLAVGSGLGILLLAAATLALAGVAPSSPSRGAEPEPGPREIVLEARGMAFYLAGDGRPNPTLRLAAGETVRITLRNLDRGMQHDVVSDSLDLRTPLLDGGEAAGLTFAAPARPGDHEYVCTLHPLLMRGRIEVR